jgi:phage tail sheath gpL-like
VSVLNKFDPSKTLYFRGFSAIDCPAAVHNASATGFTLSQVFRAASDFSVLVIFDIDDYFNHPSFKPLPDGDLTGVVLEFDLASDPTVLATLDNPKYPTIDYPFLDYVKMDGTTGRIDLSYGNLQSSLGVSVTPNTNPTTISAGSLGTAGATITVAGTPALGDSLTLWFQNFSYSYAYNVGDTLSTVASVLAAAVNAYSYSGYLYGLTATHTSGSSSFTVTASKPGVDGNSLGLYWVSSGGLSITTANPIALSGGSSAATFHVKIDFTALGIDQLRQAWLTFAPLSPPGQLLSATTGVYGDVVFSNWTVTDPNNKRPLSVAGPNSVRVEETSAWVTATGAWTRTNVGWFSQGFALVSPSLGDSITITYWCQETHDIWIGTQLYTNCGKFAVTVDGAAQPDLDCYASSSQGAFSARRKAASGLAAGQHTVTLTIIAANTLSSGTNCYFDFLEAVVASDVPSAPGPWTDRGISTDFDTQHGYQLAPARLLWMMDQLGFKGDIDHYLGVFWWSNRQISGRTLGYVTIDFSTLPALTAGTADIFITVGTTTIGKSVASYETAATWALHFELFINGLFTGLVASVSGTVLTITARDTAAAYQFAPFSAYYNNGAGNVTITPGGIGFTSASIAAGTWVIDPTQAAITYPVSQWHADYFAQVYSRGMKVAAAFSMELVYPPDANTVGSVWVQRSSNGVAILTDTGFQSYLSSQCAPGAVSFLAYQQAAYLAIAALQNAAGLTPYLQCGEFLWWFFSEFWLQPIGYLAVLSYVRLGFSSAHGMAVGDSVKVANCASITSINGTWSVVTVPDAYHIDISAPYSGGTWAGDGLVSGGSMAFYDAETAAAASTALSRPLARFTFPTDDPSVNGYADANFLANRLAAHVAAIIAYVQATYPSAVFEILWPGDVNGSTVTPISHVGGRLNHYVNLPAAWQSHTTAPFSIFKLEQLAFSTTDRVMSLVRAGLTFARTLDWPLSQMKYLYPVDNAGVPQWQEYRAAQAAGFAKMNPFAVDQICLIGWAVDPPAEQASVQVL